MVVAGEGGLGVDGPVLIYDGVCGLCSASVRFVLRTERDATLRFAAYQSDAGADLLRAHGIEPSTISSVVYVDGGRALTRSAAVLALAGHLRWPWRAVRLVRWLPRRVLDAGYAVLARWRYRLFGRRGSCSLPAGRRVAAARDRFLGEWDQSGAGSDAGQGA